MLVYVTCFCGIMTLASLVLLTAYATDGPNDPEGCFGLFIFAVFAMSCVATVFSSILLSRF